MDIVMAGIPYHWTMFKLQQISQHSSRCSSLYFRFIFPIFGYVKMDLLFFVN